jgi:hypothetical protein
MASQPGIEFLAREVCHAIDRLRGEHQTWIGLDRLEGEEGIALPATLLDAAVAFAVAKRWLVVTGAPACDVRLRLVMSCGPRASRPPGAFTCADHERV